MVQDQGKVSRRTFGLQKSRERSQLVPVRLTHPTPQASLGCRIKGCCWGAFLSAFHFFALVWWGEAFLEENRNKTSLKEIEFLCLLKE